MAFQVPSKRFTRSAPVNNNVNRVNTVNANKQFADPNAAAKASALTTANANTLKNTPSTPSQANKSSPAQTSSKVAAPAASTNNKNMQAAKAAQSSQLGSSNNSSKTASNEVTNFYDVDSALNTIYTQAKTAGITVAKPATYGKTIVNQAQAQKLADDYAAKVNQTAAANAAANNTYDITGQINSIKQQALQNGVDLSNYNPQLKYTSQAAAQSALDQYYSAAQAKIVQQVIRNDIAAADAALTHSELDELNEWNTENHNLYDEPRSINPEYILWLKRGSSGTSNPPKYIEDAYNESYEARQARQAWNSQREAQVAASQAQLKASYDATLKAAGTTHTKNPIVKINSAKVAAIAVPKTIAASSTNKKLTVIPASESKKLQSSQVADKKAVAQAASTAAAKTKTIANDAKNEASAYKKAILEKQVQIKQTVNQSTKASLQKELKSLQKEVNASQKRADVATDHAKAVESYSKAASAVVSSASLAAIQKLNTAAAKVDKTAVASAKVGVQDHSGQTLLKNGTWIDKVQRKGANSSHEVVKVYTKSEWDDAVKSAKIAMEQAQKAASNYKAAHGTLNNIELSKRPSDIVGDVKIIGAKDADGLQYVQSTSSVRTLQKTANQTISTAMLRRANAGSKVDSNKINAITGARDWLAENKIALDAKTVANTPITSDISASQEKLIQKARDKVTAPMKFAEKTQYLTTVKNMDYEAEKANKAYHAAAATYNVGNEETFKKELIEIQKATKSMNEAQTRQFLIERSAKSLPSSGKASDLWTFLNTDLVAGAGISGSVLGSIKNKLGDKTAKPLVLNGPSQTKVDKKMAGLVKSGSTADVLDNIARKQMAGESLTAAEATLLTKANGGYKQGSASKRFSSAVDTATAGVQNKLKSVGKNYKSGDNFAGVKLSTGLAEWANALQSAAVEGVGFVGGTASAAPKAVGYIGSQLSGIKSVQGAKTAFSNVAASGAIVASTTGRGMKQQYETNPKEFIATMALAEAMFSGAGKAVTKPTKYVAKQAALKTGITRAQALGSEIIPYKEAGSILDEIRYNKKITGMHGSNIRDSLNKNVYVSSPGNTIYIEPGTYGAKGRFSTLSDKYVEPYGKFFMEKSKPRFQSTRNYISAKISQAAAPVTSKIVKKSSYIDAEGVVRSRKTIVNKPVKQTVDKVNSIKAKSNIAFKPITSTKAAKAASYVVNAAVKNQMKILDNVKYRAPRTSEKVLDRLTGDTVKLSKTQWDRVYTKLSRDGNFWDEYKSITETAQKQANKLSRPVAVPSPKVAKGILEGENEVFWIFPEKGLKITSRAKIGKTANGATIYDVRYGKQAPVKSKSVLQKLKENRAYNKQFVKAIDGKKYNLNYIKSYAEDANRRLGELYENKLSRPGAYEHGKHGKTHTEQVGRNITKQGVTESAEMDYWLGVMHDVTKIGPHESAGIPHAVAAAEVIKRGLIKDARFNKFYDGLSKAKQTEFVKAINEHTTIKPINKYLVTEWDLSLKKGSDLRSPIKSVKSRIEDFKEGVRTNVKTRPSTMSKALANADRMDFTRFNVTPQKRKMFNDLKKQSKKPVTAKTIKDIKAKLAKTAERKSATLANRVKIVEQKAKARQRVKTEEKTKVAEEKRKSQYEHTPRDKSTLKMGAYAAAGYHTSYKAFTDSLGRMYKYTQQSKKSAYPASYKENAYKKGTYASNYKGSSHNYGKSDGETYRKQIGYASEKKYTVTPKSEYYKPTKGYQQKYSGKYSPKPSSYSAPYAGKYAPKTGGYTGTYSSKYTPQAGGYNGNYGPGSGYAGGNYGNDGRYVTIVKENPAILKKKKPVDKISKIKVKDTIKLQRKLANRLGSLESMFDTGVKKTSRAVKTTHKRA